MSTYYWVHCQTCDERDDTRSRNDASIIVATIKAAPFILKAQEEFEKWKDGWVRLGFEDRPCEIQPGFGWFKEHEGHEFVIGCEYGRKYRLPSAPFKHGDPPAEDLIEGKL